MVVKYDRRPVTQSHWKTVALPHHRGHQTMVRPCPAIVVRVSEQDMLEDVGDALVPREWSRVPTGQLLQFSRQQRAIVPHRGEQLTRRHPGHRPRRPWGIVHGRYHLFPGIDGLSS